MTYSNIARLDRSPDSTDDRYLAARRSNNDVLRAVADHTIPRLFQRTVERHPDDVALRWPAGDGWAEWTWRTYRDVAARTATVLAELGVVPGDRVALMLSNRPEFHATDLGALLVGAIPFSIYNSSSNEQIKHFLRDASARVLVVERGLLDSALEAAAECPDLAHVLAVDGDDGDGDDGDEPRALDRLVARCEPIDVDAAAARSRPDDVATLIYTSGTTGPPKAVLLSHRNIAATLEGRLDALGLDLQGRRLVSYLPMAHIAERSYSHYLPARTGAAVTICPDPGAINEYLLSVRPELLFGPPRVFERLRDRLRTIARSDEQLAACLAQPNAAGADALARARAHVGLDACRFALTGSAPVNPALIEFFEAIGVPIATVYGLSESCSLISVGIAGGRRDTVGVPIAGCEVRLADDGEVLSRGSNTFIGYLGDAEGSAAAIDEAGWLHTGDIGEIVDGELRIIDRKKELIVTAGGKNVSPVQIEALIKDHAPVSHVCVIGDGRPYVTALVVLADAVARDDGAAIVEQVVAGVAAANSRLNHAEQVKRIAVVDDVWTPDSQLLTATMKLRRRGIAARYAALIESIYEPKPEFPVINVTGAGRDSLVVAGG